MIVDPPPLLPLFPTAMQSTDDEHEMPVRFTALEGPFKLLQRTPLSEVAITKGAELKLVPIAMQSSTSGQAIEFNSLPAGILVGGVHPEGPAHAFTVLNEVPPPPLPFPEATQFELDAHDTDVSDATDES